MEKASLEFGQEKTMVVVLWCGRRLMDLPWQAADELAKALRVHWEGARAFLADGSNVPADPIRLGPLVVRQEQGDVLIIAGLAVIPIPAAKVPEVRSALITKARAAELEAPKVADALIADAALCIRTGAPFGLSDDPRIQEEAAKESAWNADLRRYLPGGVRSTHLLGAPSLHQFSPSQELLRLSQRMSDGERRALIATLKGS